MSRALIIGDLHCPALHPAYAEHLWETKKSWKTDKVILIGDVVDNSALNFHDKHPDAPSFAEEVGKAKKQLSTIYKMFPEADLMLGNHDVLNFRKAASVGLSETLLRGFSAFWGVPGWRTHARYSRFDYDGVIYAHGDRGKGGQQPAIKNAKELFRNYVQGHTHTQMGINWHVNFDFAVWGMNVGCGVDDTTLAMDYAKSYNNRSALGCGVVIDGIHPYVEALQLEPHYARRRR